MCRVANHPVEVRHVADRAAEVCRLAAHPVEVRRVAGHPVEVCRVAGHPVEVCRVAGHPAEVCRVAGHPVEVCCLTDRPAEVCRLSGRAMEMRRLSGRAMEMRRLSDRAMEVPVLLPRCAVSLWRCAISLNISLTSLLNRVHPVYVPSVLRPCIVSSCFLSHANWNRRSRVIKSSRMDPFKQLGCRAVQQQHQTEECELEWMGESQNAKCTRNLCSESTPLFPAIHCLASLLVSRVL